MKQLVILGAGTSGTMMANHLRKSLPTKQWEITIVDQSDEHYYQPGFLFLPFGTYKPEELKRSISEFIPAGVQYVQKKIDRIEKDDNQVLLQDGSSLYYDILLVATGVDIVPEEIEGMAGDHWHKDIFDFYTFKGSKNLRDKLENWEGGKLVVHIAEMPIKCPVAPLEFAFLADDFFRKKGMRDKVEITYVTPLPGAFTKPRATKELSYLLNKKKIDVVADFAIEMVDGENRKIIDYGGKEVEYDLLVTVPTNMGDPMVERSGIGDDLNLIPTDKNTLQSMVSDNIFVIGDATNLPASKAGSVAHFQAETLTKNIKRYIAGEPLESGFDGHANCFVETGDNKALLLDFNYDQEPVPGTFPFAKMGPLSLLKESRINHLGKMAFKWIYWNLLITGKHIPFVPSKMSLKGKIIKEQVQNN